VGVVGSRRTLGWAMQNKAQLQTGSVNSVLVRPEVMPRTGLSETRLEYTVE